MTHKREVFVSVDIETAGPIPGEYSLLSIGACDVDLTNTFSCKLKGDHQALHDAQYQAELFSLIQA